MPQPDKIMPRAILRQTDWRLKSFMQLEPNQVKSQAEWLLKRLNRVLVAAEEMNTEGKADLVFEQICLKNIAQEQIQQLASHLAARALFDAGMPEAQQNEIQDEYETFASKTYFRDPPSEQKKEQWADYAEKMFESFKQFLHDKWVAVLFTLLGLTAFLVETPEDEAVAG